jgi:hypothetical protein
MDETNVNKFACDELKVAGTKLTASMAELNKLDGAPLIATFTIGAEGSNIINIALQLKDGNGDALSVRGAIDAYFSDDANGDSVITTAPSGAVAIGTNGVLIDQIAKKAFRLISESNGTIDINITEAGAKTMYLIVILPTGKLIASTAITFA